MVNGKYYVIDSHCHIYPEKIAAAATHGTDTFYGEHSLHKGTVSDLLEQGAKAGIDRYIVQSVATAPKQVKSINEFIAHEVKNSVGKLIGLGTMHPDSDDLKGDLEHLLECGLHGVKLHPDIQDFKIDDYRCLKIYELCEQNNVPILMHAGDSRFDRSNPNRLKPVMDIYSGLTIVAAHLGGWSMWEQACDAISGMKNVYVDCSSSLSYLKPEVSKHIIETYGIDKVLFGTDYPMWSPKKEVELLLSLGFSDDDYELMFHKNAEKVFKII